MMQVPSFGRMRNVTAVKHEAYSLALVDARFSETQQILHVLQLLEVKAHVGRQDHVDHQSSELPELLPREILQDVALVLAQYAVKDKERKTFIVVCVRVQSRGPTVP